MLLAILKIPKVFKILENFLKFYQMHGQYVKRFADKMCSYVTVVLSKFENLL